MSQIEEAFSTPEERNSLAVKAVDRLITDAESKRLREDKALSDVIARCIRGTEPERLRDLGHLLEERGADEAIPAILVGSPEIAPPGELTPGSISFYAVNLLIALAEGRRLRENKKLIQEVCNCIHYASPEALRDLKWLLERQDLGRPDLQPWWAE